MNSLRDEWLKQNEAEDVDQGVLNDIIIELNGVLEKLESLRSKNDEDADADADDDVDDVDTEAANMRRDEIKNKWR